MKIAPLLSITLFTVVASLNAAPITGIVRLVAGDIATVTIDGDHMPPTGARGEFFQAGRLGGRGFGRDRHRPGDRSRKPFGEDREGERNGREGSPCPIHKRSRASNAGPGQRQPHPRRQVKTATQQGSLRLSAIGSASMTAASNTLSPSKRTKLLSGLLIKRPRHQTPELSRRCTASIVWITRPSLGVLTCSS